MANPSSPPTFDAHLLLDLIRLQINWLEREMIMLQKIIRPGVLSADSSSPRGFSALRGVWTGIAVSEQDFKAARLTLPETLP